MTSPVLQMALEALRLARYAIEPLTDAQIKLHRISRSTADKIDSAIAALQEAAIQQQPEPVAPNEWANEAATVMAQFIHLSAQPDRDAWAQNASRAIRLLNAPSLQQQEVPSTDAAWVQRLRETAAHLRDNSLSLAKYPDMKDEARAREMAALYIGEIAALFEARRAVPSPSPTEQQEGARDSGGGEEPGEGKQ